MAAPVKSFLSTLFPVASETRPLYRPLLRHRSQTSLLNNRPPLWAAAVYSQLHPLLPPTRPTFTVQLRTGPTLDTLQQTLRLLLEKPRQRRQSSPARTRCGRSKLCTLSFRDHVTDCFSLCGHGPWAADEGAASLATPCLHYSSLLPAHPTQQEKEARRPPKPSYLVIHQGDDKVIDHT